MSFLPRDGVLIIAEAGVNHNGDYDMAIALIDAAADAGADAVKFQTFNADLLATRTVATADYQRENSAQTSQYELLKKLELPYDWHAPLKKHASNRGIEFLSTAFDIDSLRFLDGLGLPGYKVPSGELTNSPLLWQFAQFQKPLILSTGMATLAEIETALAVCAHSYAHQDEPNSIDEVMSYWQRVNCGETLGQKVAILHCTSQYPAPLEQLNLNAISLLEDTYNLMVGYSDHSPGIDASITAVACGARIIEKHFTLDRNLPGPDHQASLLPAELAAMIEGIRATEIMLGKREKQPQPCEVDTKKVVRQSVIAARPIDAGHHIEREDLTTARAGAGLPASQLWDLIGTVAKKSFAAGEIMDD